MDSEKLITINKAFYSTQGKAFDRYMQSQKEALQMVYNEAYKKGYQDGRKTIKKDAK